MYIKMPLSGYNYMLYTYIKGYLERGATTFLTYCREVPIRPLNSLYFIPLKCHLNILHGSKVIEFFSKKILLELV